MSAKWIILIIDPIQILNLINVINRNEEIIFFFTNIEQERLLFLLTMGKKELILTVMQDTFLTNT